VRFRTNDVFLVEPDSPGVGGHDPSDPVVLTAT